MSLTDEFGHTPECSRTLDWYCRTCGAMTCDCGDCECITSLESDYERETEDS